MADLFAQHSVYIFDNTSNKHYVPFIYDGENFIYCHAFIISADAKTTAYVGEAVAGYSIIGMG